MRLALGLGLASCAPTALVDHAAWREATTDPLAGHRVDGCGGAAWGVEDGALEAWTSGCSYLALDQPAGREGRDLHLVAWHGGLDAPEPGIAHLAVLIGDAVVWEVWPEIPAEATIWDESVSTSAWRRGDRIGLHLHNHGANSWTLLTLE